MVETIERILAEILANHRTIAVTGLSSDPEHLSRLASRTLHCEGFRVIQVNPVGDPPWGQESYPTLEAIPYPVDCIDIFGDSAAVPGIVASAIAIGAKTVWLEEGVANGQAVVLAESAGLNAVQGRCLAREVRESKVRWMEGLDRQFGSRAR